MADLGALFKGLAGGFEAGAGISQRNQQLRQQGEMAEAQNARADAIIGLQAFRIEQEAAKAEREQRVLEDEFADAQTLSQLLGGFQQQDETEAQTFSFLNQARDIASVDPKDRKAFMQTIAAQFQQATGAPMAPAVVELFSRADSEKLVPLLDDAVRTVQRGEASPQDLAKLLASPEQATAFFARALAERKAQGDTLESPLDTQQNDIATRLQHQSRVLHQRADQLRQAAGRLRNPVKALEMADDVEKRAFEVDKQIAQFTKPVSVGPNSTLVDPSTREVLFQGRGTPDTTRAQLRDTVGGATINIDTGEVVAPGSLNLIGEDGRPFAMPIRNRAELDAALAAIGEGAVPGSVSRQQIRTEGEIPSAFTMLFPDLDPAMSTTEAKRQGLNIGLSDKKLEELLDQRSALAVMDQNLSDFQTLLAETPQGAGVSGAVARFGAGVAAQLPMLANLAGLDIDPSLMTPSAYEDTFRRIGVASQQQRAAMVSAAYAVALASRERGGKLAQQDIARALEQLGGSQDPAATIAVVQQFKQKLPRNFQLTAEGLLGRRPVVPDATPPPAGLAPPQRPEPSPAAAPTALPPQALQQLREGAHTRFGNGQVWTLRNGQPVQVQ